MSYEIYYDKQFVKLPSLGEVIPMILHGSNNCYEIRYNGGQRRERTWYALTWYTAGRNIPSAKGEAILAKIDEEIQGYIDRCLKDDWYKKEGYTEEQVRKNYGYFSSLSFASGGTRGLSAAAYRSFFATGIRKALTVEELHELGVHLRFSVYDYGRTFKPPVPKLEEIKTEADYLYALAKMTDWSKAVEVTYEGKTHTGADFSLYFDGTNDSVTERLRAGRRMKIVQRPTVTVEEDHYFVLSNENGELLRYTSRGFKYSYNKGRGKPFRTAKEAEARRARLVADGRHKAETWKVERIDQPRSFKTAAKREVTCPHDFTPADNEGPYGKEQCRFCGERRAAA